MPRTVPWNDSYIENHIKWSYRVVVHEPKNRSRESLATKVDIPDCPGLSRTVNPLFLSPVKGNLKLKTRAPEQYSLWSYCSGALVFNFKFFQKSFAGRPWRPNFFLLLSPSLSPLSSLFPSFSVHDSTGQCRQAHEHARCNLGHVFECPLLFIS